MGKIKKNRDVKNQRGHGIKLKVILMVLIFIYGFVVFYPKKKTETLPVQVWGKWITKAPKYKDRFFELSEVSIIFGIGDNKIDVYFIKEFKQTDENEGILFTIIGHNLDKIEHKFSFYYNKIRTAQIRLKNQENIIWTREKSKKD